MVLSRQQYNIFYNCSWSLVFTFRSLYTRELRGIDIKLRLPSLFPGQRSPKQIYVDWIIGVYRYVQQLYGYLCEDYRNNRGGNSSKFNEMCEENSGLGYMPQNRNTWVGYRTASPHQCCSLCGEILAILTTKPLKVNIVVKLFAKFGSEDIRLWK